MKGELKARSEPEQYLLTLYHRHQVLNRASIMMYEPTAIWRHSKTQLFIKLSIRTDTIFPTIQDGCYCSLTL